MRLGLYCILSLLISLMPIAVAAEDDISPVQQLIRLSDHTAVELEDTLSGIYGTGYFLRDNPRILSEYKLNYEMAVRSELSSYLTGIYKMRRHTGAMQQAGLSSRIGYSRSRKFIRTAFLRKREQINYLLSLDDKTFSYTLFPEQEIEKPLHHLYSEVAIAGNYLKDLQNIFQNLSSASNNDQEVKYQLPINDAQVTAVARLDGFSEIVASVGRDLLAKEPLSLVKPPAAGEVLFAGYCTGFGNLVITRHADGIISLTGNMASTAGLNPGAVTLESTIGYVGSSGRVFQAFFQGDSWLDPAEIYEIEVIGAGLGEAIEEASDSF
ncbi:MAG: M23 family metallopeptidase [bacterium]|nr:M23 family metallopeptidase [bacterium]